MNDAFEQEIQDGERFQFGKNWAAFLRVVDEERIENAVAELRGLLQVESLAGKTFVDVGCGSGLHSLAAIRLGAKVVSLDYDPQCVACTESLRERFAPDAEWEIRRDSALDETLAARLGSFDVVYSWGVLHHTGDMWGAIGNTQGLVGQGGTYAIALYNDQDVITRWWTFIKRLYNKSALTRALVVAAYFPWFFVRGILVGLVREKNPFAYYTGYKKQRGMSAVHDWFDWLGGLPFEVARVEAVMHFLQPHGFTLANLISTNRHGCNQLVFRKNGGA